RDRTARARSPLALRGNVPRTRGCRHPRDDPARRPPRRPGLLPDGRYLFFDWGDSCVSHPFHSLTVILRSIAWKLDLPPGGRELERLRDAYLEPFGAGPDLGDLGYQSGTIARAIAWHRMVKDREPDFVTEDDLAAPAYGIKLFLEDGPIG